MSHTAPTGFDFKSPDYAAIFQQRAKRLAWIRANPKKLPELRRYYKDNIAQFITDWGLTFDPRNAERGLPSTIPFILFDRQAEWVDEFISAWKNQEPFLTEKTRDMGMSWLSVAVAATICLFYEGIVAGFGSRKEEYVDKIGAPKSLFYKMRMFLKYLPPEFRGGFDELKHAPHMRISIPSTGSYVAGESGDGIGRGDRSSFYFVDESAFLERPQLVEASLSQTTNCRVDISTPNGSDNPFAQKALGGKIRKFRFHWRDDPRKDDAWYADQVDKLDPVTVAQEIDIDYNASKEGIVIPTAWVQAAIGAAEKLGIEVTGDRRGYLDVADRGQDKCAFVGRHGVELAYCDQWSGSTDTDDIFETVERCFDICDFEKFGAFDYDADGLGAGVRGDSRVINERREDAGQSVIEVGQFRGSGAIVDPEGEMVEGRLNKDHFVNLKAQGWWWLRTLFLNTYRAVIKGSEFDPDLIVSIDKNIDNLQGIISELSQPVYLKRNGKILIDKAPEGSLSPNLADAVMMAYAPKETEAKGFFDL